MIGRENVKKCTFEKIKNVQEDSNVLRKEYEMMKNRTERPEKECNVNL